MDTEEIKQLANDVNHVAETSFQAGLKAKRNRMEETIIINKKEARIIRQALMIWRGAFPDTGCEPSKIWQSELTELVDKCDILLKDGGNSGDKP